MDNSIRGPSKIRKRAAKACLACRARKVRCDVSQRGRPCMNCYLDNETCVVTSRATRRRKQKDDGSNVGNSGTSIEPPNDSQRRGSGESSAAIEQVGDANMSPATPSDAGSENIDGGSRALNELSKVTIGGSNDGRSAVRNADANTQRIPLKYAPMPAPPLQPYSPAPASLHWSGEQSTRFGADITYTYYPFIEVNNLSSIPPQDVNYLDLQGCLRVPTKTILDEFVKQFFLHVHPIMPLLNEGDFWEMYASQSQGTHVSKRISLLMLQAMMFSVCGYVARSNIKALGFPDVKFARSAFYRRAKLLFDFGSEYSPIAVAQATLLLSSWAPNPSGNNTRVSSSWLSVSIQQAKIAGAHRYSSLHQTQWPESQRSRVLKHQNDLKRLWWCIVLRDRILSLSFRTSIQVTRVHFDFDAETHAPLGFADLSSEIERSRVYNSGTKKSLIEILAHHIQLMVALTDLLVLVWPLDEVPQWARRHGEEEVGKIERCKGQLRSWYQRSTSRFPMPGDEILSRPNMAGRGGRGAEFHHDSVVLYTNLMYITYHSAMTRLCHHECLQLTLASISTRPGGTLPDPSSLAKNGLEIRDAASGAVRCLMELVQLRLSKWLPLSSTSCTSLPLILHVIDAKLPSQSNPKLPSLHDLVEAVRSYQSAPDSLDWMYDAVRGIVSLSQIQDPGRISSPSLTAENLGAVNSTSASASEFACHPSVHLRLALVMDSDLKRSKSLNTRDLSAGIARLFSSDSVNRIKALLSQVPQQKHTPSAGSSRIQSNSSNPDNTSRKQTLADWGQVDQSMIFAIELGLVPAEPAAGDSSSDSASAMSVGTEDDNAVPAESARLLHRVVDSMDWKDIAGQAFSETGDNAERDVLGAFIFRDQPPGASEGYVMIEEDSGGPGNEGSAFREAPPESADDDGDLETANALLGAVTG
ncbi:cutinase transcription factor 1 beta [Diaporthe amygdali]|uniref:cutinase transcription factor 1 beta n=1 Tax=Phomopsis amygdali TaxID=1214568 RepID=UPI0022FE0895|nr:cutinase transcription factor 1 beta [Diaporthe amygdali]KAJ0122430.1 cutinase transcription factor 1 beta [Diaporthe amygdali]